MASSIREASITGVLARQASPFKFAHDLQSLRFPLPLKGYALRRWTVGTPPRQWVMSPPISRPHL